MRLAKKFLVRSYHPPALPSPSAPATSQVRDISRGHVHTPGVLLHTQDTEAPTEAADELLEEDL